jgi:uncharacterized glyoxalase superfamily protein PhnB
MAQPPLFATRKTSPFFWTERESGDGGPRCILYFEVPNVDTEYQRLTTNGVESVHGPQDNSWGYGPELRDLDGHSIRHWDTRSVE